MIHAKVDQTELRKLLKNINRYGDHVKKQVQDEIQYTAQEIRSESQQRVRVVTGTLKKSAYVNGKRNRLGAQIGHKVHYAVYVEFGTTKQRAQPYLLPSFERITPMMINEIKKILSNRKAKFKAL